MKKKLFEYVVLHHEKDVRDTVGNIKEGQTTVITDLSHMLAKDDKEVGMRIARELPDAYMDKLDEVEIIIRPFN